MPIAFACFAAAAPLSRPNRERCASHSEAIIRSLNDRELPLGGSIANAFYTRMLCAMSAAIDDTSSFDAVSNHMALAVRAPWRHGVNGAFEAVECHGLSGLRDAKCLVVVVTADITNGHINLPLLDRIRSWPKRK
jgi:hypothetical protein